MGLNNEILSIIGVVVFIGIIILCVTNTDEAYSITVEILRIILHQFIICFCVVCKIIIWDQILDQILE